MTMMLDSQDNDLLTITWHLNNGYMRGRIDKKRVYAHRIVAQRMGIKGLSMSAHSVALKKRSVPQRRKTPEYDQQKSLFTWARLSLRKYPDLDMLSCSLNGVKLSTAQAGKAKAAGMLAGEHDVKLPIKRGGYVALSIELKHGKNKPTEKQLWYGKRLSEQGWLVAYCWSWNEAADLIKNYLDGRLIKE